MLHDILVPVIVGLGGGILGGVIGVLVGYVIWGSSQLDPFYATTHMTLHVRRPDQPELQAGRFPNTY